MHSRPAPLKKKIDFFLGERDCCAQAKGEIVYPLSRLNTCNPDVIRNSLEFRVFLDLLKHWCTCYSN